jgi:glycosyltransferase involved in cell wall biosynthesis
MLIYLITGGEIYDIGGVSRYIRELANYLYSTGFHVKIISKMGRIASINSENLIAIKTVNVNGNKSRKNGSSHLSFILSHLPNPLTTILGILVLVRDIKNECNSEKIIHIHDATSSLLIAFIINKILNIPFLVQIHGFPIKEQKIKLARENSLINNFIWFLTKTWHVIAIRLMKRCAILLVNNKEVKSFYKSCGIPSEKLEVVPSAVNLIEFIRHLLSENKARKCLGFPSLKNTITIGFVGGLKPEKNAETLVKAFGKLIRDIPELKARLIIIGDGPMRLILEEHIKEHGINGCVFFLGYIPDAYRFLNAIDIFVLPSLSEGCPLALLEAMACGRAIIASDIPAIREIVEDGKEALLFDPFSSDQLKEAILKLYHNSELRRELGENAKMKARRYDINVVFPKIVKAYQEVLRNKILNKNNTCTCQSEGCLTR